VNRDGTGDRALTFGDSSFVEPDVHAAGKLLASRIRGQSDIWRFPIGGSPADNTRNAIQVTRQSGQVQTPSVSPDGTEVAYLSDNGGHANLWVTKTDGSGSARQITFERDPATTLGCAAVVTRRQPHCVHREPGSHLDLRRQFRRP
jgi:Tol biopolymer transport system component